MLVLRRLCSIRWPVSRRGPMVGCPTGSGSASPSCPSRTLSNYGEEENVIKMSG